MFDFSAASTGRARPIKSASSRPMEDYRRESLRARGSRPRRDVRLAGDDERRRAAHGRRGDRGAARSRRRDLLERRFQVDAVNPKQLDRFRDPFTVAGAKDDRRDAYVLADALRTDRHCFRRLTVEDPVVIELREWSRMAEDLQQERNRLANRVREQLWRYYPQHAVDDRHRAEPARDCPSLGSPPRMPSRWRRVRKRTTRWRGRSRGFAFAKLSAEEASSSPRATSGRSRR